MKKDAIYIGIIIILLSFVVVMTCTGPDPVDPGKQVYIERNDSLIQQLAFKEAQFDSAVSMANTLSKEKDSVVVASTREITRLTRNASKARTPKVDTLILDNPELKVFVETQDSVIQEQGILIDTLKSQAQFERGVREQLTALHYDQSKIQSNLYEYCEIERIRLQDMNERLRKKAKGKGLFFGLGFGAGWLARSGLERL